MFFIVSCPVTAGNGYGVPSRPHDPCWAGANNSFWSGEEVGFSKKFPWCFGQEEMTIPQCLAGSQNTSFMYPSVDMRIAKSAARKAASEENMLSEHGSKIGRGSTWSTTIATLGMVLF